MARIVCFTIKLTRNTEEISQILEVLPLHDTLLFRSYDGFIYVNSLTVKQLRTLPEIEMDENAYEFTFDCLVCLAASGFAWKVVEELGPQEL